MVRSPPCPHVRTYFGCLNNFRRGQNALHHTLRVSQTFYADCSQTCLLHDLFMPEVCCFISAMFLAAYEWERRGFASGK
ncbi:hypothetical protein V2G26_016551 [Clonostachys chloroleuca]